MLCRRYTAQQALDWGLVNAVVPLADLDAEVDRWCQELLAMSPTALKTIKRSIDDAFAGVRHYEDAPPAQLEVTYDGSLSRRRTSSPSTPVSSGPANRRRVPPPFRQTGPDFSRWR